MEAIYRAPQRGEETQMTAMLTRFAFAAEPPPRETATKLLSLQLATELIGTAFNDLAVHVQPKHSEKALSLTDTQFSYAQLCGDGQENMLPSEKRVLTLEPIQVLKDKSSLSAVFTSGKEAKDGMAQFRICVPNGPRQLH